ncbi:MAG: tetratricopeptide repeat protein [bacterium]|nr:tetratricopeptide repeat protein [bacterium]
MRTTLLLFLSFFAVCTYSSAVHAQSQGNEEQLIRAVTAAKSPQQRFESMLDLGDYYKANNIDKADSLREELLNESRKFEDSLRFTALMYSAEVYLIRGDLDSYYSTILACQPFLNKLKGDEVQFTIYRHLGFYHSKMQEFETAKSYLKLALKKAKRIRDIAKQSETYQHIALNFMRFNEKDSSLHYANKAINAGRRSGNKAELARSFNTIAQVYSFFGQVELGVAKNLVALQLAQGVGNSLLLARFCREVGQTQREILNLDDAEYYFRRSLSYSQAINDKRQMALALTFLATVQLDRDQYDKAIKNANRSTILLTELNDINGLGLTHNVLGLVYKEQENYSEASINFNKALVFYESAGNKQEIAEVYHNVGTVFKEQKRYQNALNYLNRSIEIREQYKAKSQIYQTYRVIADVYKELNNSTLALEYMEKYLDYVDSNTTVQAATRIAELSESYRSEQRERLINAQADSIQRQRQEREMTTARLEYSQLRNNFQMYIIIAFIIIIVMAGLILFYRWNQTQIKQRQREAEMSQTLLRTQMNPHFVFNAMSVIQSYIYENDTENSSKFLVNFSRLMRLILENSPKEQIPMETEIEILSKYLAMQKLRFQERFEYEIVADDELIAEAAQIPPMITQPFIENSIEHGQLHTIEGGFIRISFTKVDKMLHITIIDNGIGRKASKAKKKSSAHRSMAMEITAERVENLNKKFRTDRYMHIEDYNKEEETGTKVLISLPYTSEA